MKIKFPFFVFIICNFFFAILFNACISVKQIGKVNMISNRNVDPDFKYQSLTTYSGGSNRELKNQELNR